MKTIIAGGRDQKLTEEDIAYLNMLDITEVVSGCAKGIDTEGEIWANESNIPVKRFPAEWKLYGKVAGFMRNAQMAEYADVLVAFPGGNGTNHMVNTATKHGLIIHDRRSRRAGV